MSFFDTQHDLCAELGKQYVENKAYSRKKKVYERFTLDEIKSSPAVRATVALRLGNIELEKDIEMKHFEEL